MAVTYGFYNSLNHDRVYDAEQLSSMFDGFIVDGVFMTIGGQLMVTPGTSGLSVNVASGKAWFNHTWTLNDASLQLVLNAAETLFGRIDAVVVEVNTNTRVNSIKVVTGTPSSSPVSPTLNKTGGVYQYPLAYINVNANASSITTANVSNKIGSTDCPWVTGITEGIDADALYARWEAQWRASMSGMSTNYDHSMEYWTNTFNTSMDSWNTSADNQRAEFDTEFNDWFDSVKGQVSDDLGTSLSLEVTEHGTQISNLQQGVNDINSDISGINNSISGINTTLSEHGTQISNLQQGVNDINSDISGINNSISGINTTLSEHGTQISNLQQTVQTIVLAAHPVGSYYWSSDSTNPMYLFGGQWTQITDRFVYAAGSIGAGATGGAGSVWYTPSGSISGTALNTDQIPWHTHGSRNLTGTIKGLCGRSDSSNNGIQTSGIITGAGNGNYCSESNSLKNIATITINATHEHDGVGGNQAHAHGFTGNGASISTMPPYITAYCWRRTA